MRNEADDRGVVTNSTNYEISPLGASQLYNRGERQGLEEGRRI